MKKCFIKHGTYLLAFPIYRTYILKVDENQNFVNKNWICLCTMGQPFNKLCLG